MDYYGIDTVLILFALTCLALGVAIWDMIFRK